MGLLLLLVVPNVTHALSILQGFTSNAIGDVAFFFTFIIAYIFGVFIAVESWLLEIVLVINQGVFNDAFVQSGFSISLSIANLAFVLGIIVIAIATIIRNETYGIKQLLWKLVVAAVLVNFGLVIAAPIFGLGNSFAQYFINCIGPTSGGCSGTGSSVQSYDAFATAFAGAFNPQTNLTTISNQSAAKGATSNSIKVSNNIAGILAADGGGGIGKLLVGIVGMIYTSANLILLALVLAGLGVLLLIRYIYISILAILMPFAWASWVFPAFGNHWKKWWDQFLRWTFFAPIAFFFIYLSMLLMQNGGAYSAFADPNSGAGQSAVGAAVIAFFGNLFGPVMQEFVRELIFGGLIIGGLIAADKMGLAGAKTVTGAVTDRAKAVGSWTGRKAKTQAGKLVPDKVKEKLQRGEYRFAPKRLQTSLGVGIGNLQRGGRAGVIEDEMKYAEALAKDPAQFQRILAQKAGTFGRGAVSEKRQMAMLAHLSQNEDLQKAVMKAAGVKEMGHLVVGTQNVQAFLKGNKGEFDKFQQQKAYGALEDKTGLKMATLQEKAEAENKTMVELTEASSGRHMTDEETERYNSAKDRRDEALAEVRSWIVKNLDPAAAFFQDNDKARKKLTEDGKPIPLTLQPETLGKIHETMFTAIAAGFSPTNLNELLKTVAKNNNLDNFQNTMDEFTETTRRSIQTLAKSNTPLKNYIQHSANRSMVDFNKMFDIESVKGGGHSADEDEDDHA